MDTVPIVSAEDVACASVRYEGLMVDREDVYWIESRPAESGRFVLMRQRGDEEPHEVLPRNFSVRNCLHEYGGGACAVRHGVVVFVSGNDGRLYRFREGTRPVALTPRDDGRYGDLSFDPIRRRVYAVRERDRDEIVAVRLDGKGVTTLVSGADFYAAPRVSPDGKKLAWITWQSPNMPWDETTLWTGAIKGDRVLTHGITLPYGSSLDPQWASDGSLWFVTDASGWWRLHRWGKNGHSVPLVDDDAEYAVPPWTSGLARFRFLSPRRALVVRRVQGKDHVGIIDRATSTFKRLPLGFSEVRYLAVDKDTGTIALVAGNQLSPLSVFRLHLGRKTWCRAIRGNDHETGDVTKSAFPEAVSFPSEDGSEAHGFYYAPHGTSPKTPPPLIIITHGGPTGATSTLYNPMIQYWTSRGFAILDVNYGGSTGYGRAYRERLRGKWGIVDVADCVAGVKAMIARGYADSDRVVIRGGSAGGYTTLACLAFTKNIFKAGACYYGIGNLETLTGAGTDRFESQYLDGLVPSEERRNRSPLWHADRISCPVIFFHGALDKAVPPEQSEAMVTAMRAHGVRAERHVYSDEYHGFRNAQNIADALTREYEFYRRILKM